MDRCDIRGCRAEADITYLEHGLCKRHWNELTAEDAPPDTLRVVLGIEATAEPAMEDSMDDAGSKTAKAVATTTAAGSRKGKASPKARSPQKAKPKATKPKAAKETKPRKALEAPVVFAFRLEAADRDVIHKAAGPAGATRFVRSAALAAARGDAAAFEELTKQAKSNLS